MLAHSAKIPPTPVPTHTSTGFNLSGMKAICKQNQCGCQTGDQWQRTMKMRAEESGVYSFRHRGKQTGDLPLRGTENYKPKNKTFPHFKQYQLTIYTGLQLIIIFIIDSSVDCFSIELNFSEPQISCFVQQQSKTQTYSICNDIKQRKALNTHI